MTNTKELADLQKEIASLGKRGEALEEDILEAMVYVEDAQGEKESAEQSLADIQAAWDKETASLKQEQNELALRVHKLNGKRKTQASAIPKTALAEYLRIAKKKGGVAVAKLRVNQCLACQLTVSANKVKDAREGKMVTCGSCGRILHPA